MDDSVTIETIQNCEAIVEANKAEFNMFDERTPFGKETFTKVASIPMSLFVQWQKQGIIDTNGEGNLKGLKKMLNDGDFGAFRTRPGKL